MARTADAEGHQGEGERDAPVCAPHTATGSQASAESAAHQSTQPSEQRLARGRVGARAGHRSADNAKAAVAAANEATGESGVSTQLESGARAIAQNVASDESSSRTGIAGVAAASKALTPDQLSSGDALTARGSASGVAMPSVDPAEPAAPQAVTGPQATTTRPGSQARQVLSASGRAADEPASTSTAPASGEASQSDGKAAQIGDGEATQAIAIPNAEAAGGNQAEAAVSEHSAGNDTSQADNSMTSASAPAADSASTSPSGSEGSSQSGRSSGLTDSTLDLTSLRSLVSIGQGYTQATGGQIDSAHITSTATATQPATLQRAGDGHPAASIAPEPSQSVDPASSVRSAADNVVSVSSHAPATEGEAPSSSATGTSFQALDGSPSASVTATGAPSDQPQLQANSSTTASYAPRMQQAIETIHATVALASRQGAAQAQISLEPAELGAVKIHLTQTSEGLIARVSAQTAAGAEAIASGRSELHSTLSSLGVSLLRLDIGSFSGQQTNRGGHAPADLQRQSKQERLEEEGEPEATTEASTRTVSLYAGGSLVDVLA
jgi:flagellar hook-length control protein FliK